MQKYAMQMVISPWKSIYNDMWECCEIRPDMRESTNREGLLYHVRGKPLKF